MNQQISKLIDAVIFSPNSGNRTGEQQPDIPGRKLSPDPDDSATVVMDLPPLPAIDLTDTTRRLNNKNLLDKHYKDTYRILIVDDEDANLKAMADLLRDDYLPVLARSGKQALRHAFSDTPPDLILLDVLMPGMGGHEVITALNDNDKTSHIPVIFVTSLSSAEDEERGLRLGAVDYITKPYSPPIVKMRVRNHLRAVQQRRLLDQLAYLDGLTEISNRRRFEEVFHKEWARSDRNGTPLSLAMLDVDFFKQYNDNYGHAMGDDALRRIAGALSSVARRPADLIARYGGEEFVMLLPETNGPAAKKLAQRALQNVNDLNIPHYYSQAARHVSLSIGLVTKGIDHHGASAKTFIHTADKNLYRAKENGKNQLVATVIGW